jgi:hypothetical protein
MDIVLVMHSYGGVARRQTADCQAAGKTRGISGLAYLTSLILPVSKSMQMLAGGTKPDYVHVDVSLLRVSSRQECSSSALSV